MITCDFKPIIVIIPIGFNWYRKLTKHKLFEIEILNYLNSGRKQRIEIHRGGNLHTLVTNDTNYKVIHPHYFW